MRQRHPEQEKHILLAYLIPTVVWFIITCNDFIAYRQQTIADCRRLGRKHLLLISIPAIYLACFSALQVRIRDYKTMSLGIFAFTFTLLHLWRTFYGLWQLQVFKQWLITSLIKMESFGYRARLPPKNRSDGEVDMRPMEKRRGETLNQALARLDQYADQILVKENLMDGIRNSRGVPCDFYLLSGRQVAAIQARETMLGGFVSCFSHSVMNIFKIPLLLYSLSFDDSPNYLYINEAPFFLPLEPEKLWVRWACTLASQLPDWVDDICNSGPMTESHRQERRQRARNNMSGHLRGFPPFLLAVEHARRLVTANPSLVALEHVRRLVEANPELAHLRWHLRDFDEENEVEVSDTTRRETEERRRRESSNCTQHRTVPFKKWMKHPGFFRCMSCKQKLLQKVFDTGNGLPYGMQHCNARKWEGDDAPLGYDQFRMELSRAKGMLPMTVEEKIVRLGVRELEWLAVFLGI